MKLNIISTTIFQRHSMFQGKAQTDLIRMCDNCRVITLAERGGDPMAMGERPRVRTTDDYIVGKAIRTKGDIFSKKLMDAMGKAMAEAIE